MILEKCKKLVQQCFCGDLTMPKVNFWLIGSICLLAGVVYGLCIAPLTHGVRIACNNNNQNGCHCGCGQEKENKEEES